MPPRGAGWDPRAGLPILLQNFMSSALDRCLRELHAAHDLRHSCAVRSEFLDLLLPERPYPMDVEPQTNKERQAMSSSYTSPRAGGMKPASTKEISDQI